jgi:thiol-disulfide isomerase/thioredoxin
MKLHILLASIWLVCSSFTPATEFKKWTDTAGRVADLQLISTSGDEGQKIGRFKTINGASISISASNLCEADAKHLNDWVAPSTSNINEQTTKSIFDETIKTDLVRIEGRRVSKYKITTPPTKYYIFYYSASWCSPCQAFTPKLVNWYLDNIKNNPHFELIFVSSDRSSNDMEDYVKTKHMPWPAIKFSKIEDFKSTFPHQIKGIPSVIVCNLKGEIVANTCDLIQLTQLIK